MGCWQTKTTQHYYVSIFRGSVEWEHEGAGQWACLSTEATEQQHDRLPIKQLRGAGAGLISLNPDVGWRWLNNWAARTRLDHNTGWTDKISWPKLDRVISTCKIGIWNPVWACSGLLAVLRSSSVPNSRRRGEACLLLLQRIIIWNLVDCFLPSLPCGRQCCQAALAEQGRRVWGGGDVCI